MNRGVFQLALANAILMSVTSLMVTAAAIIGSHLATNQALSTLPQALQFVAVMATTIPASLLMRRIGRKAGFLLATVVGLIGGGCAVAAIYLESFWLFCFGTLGVGVYTGFGHYYRFAATEVATPEAKNTAISYVLAGGVLAAIVGPNLANYSKDWFAVTYAGTMLSVVLLYGFNGINFLCMRLPRPDPAVLQATTRSLKTIVLQPTFIIAVASAAIGYATMVLLMTATPLAMMRGHAHEFSDVAFVIQWHVLGMFVPSFFTGHLINRFGAARIITTGVVLMVACVGFNLHGTTVTHFWAALLLLGIGWNFMYIGGTSLLTETYTPAEAAQVQAINEFVVFSSAACASFAAGALLHWLGWIRVNQAVIPLAALAILAQLWLYLVRRRGASTLTES